MWRAWKSMSVSAGRRSTGTSRPGSSCLIGTDGKYVCSSSIVGVATSVCGAATVTTWAPGADTSNAGSAARAASRPSR